MSSKDDTGRYASRAEVANEPGLLISLSPLVLLASWPFVSFLATNRLESVYTSRILLIWIGFIALCFAGLGLLKLIFRTQPLARLSLAIGVLAAWTFSYLPVARLLAAWGIELGRPRLLIWLFVALLLLFAVSRMRQLREISIIAIVVAAAMMAIPVAQLFAHVVQTGEVSEVQPQPAVGKNAPTASTSEPQGTEQKPNVYWFVLDAYTRHDVLKEQAGFDNKPFLNSLENRGFQVGWESLSNYKTTMRSISTTMAMEYYLPVAKKLAPGMWQAKLQGFNPIVERFKSYGYRYVHAESGSVVQNLRCGGNENLCILAPVRGAGATEVEIGLLQLTPLFPILRTIYPAALSIHPADVRDVMNALPDKPNEPFFLFSHILSPHTPNRFKKNCTRRDMIEWNPGIKQYGKPEVVAGYVTDIKCINNELLEGIDAILARDESDPIIIIQADHGAPIGNFASKEKELLSRFAVLNVIRFSQGCGQQFHPAVSLVNTFRMVFSCIERQPIPLLPDRQFDRTKTGRLKEVTVQ